MPDPPDERTEPMSRILYLEGASGISGDMTVAALLDLGGNKEHLAECLKSLHLDEFDYEISRKKSYGLGSYGTTPKVSPTTYRIPE